MPFFRNPKQSYLFDTKYYTDRYRSVYQKLKLSKSGCARNYVTEARMIWALEVVRSRAFSGIYEGMECLGSGWPLGPVGSGLVARPEALHSVLPKHPTLIPT